MGEPSKNLVSPVTTFKEVTKSNSVDLMAESAGAGDIGFRPRAIMVTSGIVILEDEAGNVTQFADGTLATGVWLPMRPAKVRATDDTVSPAVAATATVYIGK